MTETPSFTITLEQEQGFDFRVKFDWPDNPDLLLDEPEPLGKHHRQRAAAAQPHAQHKRNRQQRNEAGHKGEHQADAGGQQQRSGQHPLLA